jgi:hypothetical protein
LYRCCRLRGKYMTWTNILVPVRGACVPDP